MSLPQSRTEINQKVAASLCKSSLNDLGLCYKVNHHRLGMPCYRRGQCRIAEKSEQQIKYVYSPVTGHLLLEACPGSGKTEVVGIKAAYEMQRWENQFFGMAVLTFTNTATNEIQGRVRSFSGRAENHPHFVGTFDSWLHSFIVQPFGYQVERFSGTQSDRTMRLIGDRKSLPFLHSFRVWPKNKGDAPLLVNEYTWDPYLDSFYYYPGGVRTVLDPCKWNYKSLKVTKQKLWHAGFFTYDDADNISYQMTKRKVGRRLAARFPYIIVDECQDLSPCKLGILQNLAEQGSRIHLVGDMNQSIFGFTGADPVKTQEFVSDLDFSRERLNQNYRSAQQIVNVSNNIICQEEPVLSCSSSEKESSVVVFEYPDKNYLTKVPGKYLEFLQRKGISPDESVIMARGKSTLWRLGAAIPNLQTDGVTLLANVCHQCIDTDSFFEHELLVRQFGKFIHSIFFEGLPLAGHRTYSCPEGYSPIEWRLLVFRILNKMKATPDIANLEQSWSEWLKSVKMFFRKNVCEVEGWSDAKVKKLRAPRGKSKEFVSLGVDKNSTQLLVRATTIHDIKGESVGAALLVSSADRSGNTGGHWTDWLSSDDPEHARFAYVASSRPIHTLGWAVPKLSEDQRRQILDLGFDEIVQWDY